VNVTGQSNLTERKINSASFSVFRRDTDDICALLGYYAALSGSSVPTFSQPIGPIFKGFLDP
jgi:hypothetical protein